MLKAAVATSFLVFVVITILQVLLDAQLFMASTCCKSYNDEKKVAVNSQETNSSALPKVVHSSGFDDFGNSTHHPSEENNSLATVSSQETNSSVLPKVVELSGYDDVSKLMREMFRGKHLVCETFNGKQPGTLTIDFDCDELFRNSKIGTGNFIMAFYATRLVARLYGNINVNTRCNDADQVKANLILPWIMGNFPASETQTARLQAVIVGKHRAHVCHSPPLAFIAEAVKNELRRLAIAMVGFPDENHATADTVRLWFQAEKLRELEDEYQLPLSNPNEPLFPNTTLDDAVIHFRCGDLMSSGHPAYGFLKFGAFSTFISAQVNTIGVVTQPFEASNQTRNVDDYDVTGSRCRLVIGEFVAFLQEEFPQAVVRVHNDPDETIALTYARMIMANQTFAAFSSFGMFPAIANFGTGYFQAHQKYRWMQNPTFDTVMDDFVMMNETNILMSEKMIRLLKTEHAEKTIIDWFRDYDLIL